MTSVTHLFRALGLRVVAGPVELRGAGDDDPDASAIDPSSKEKA